MEFLKLVKVFFQWILMPFHWMFMRLPRGFTIPLVIILFLYFFMALPRLVYVSIPWLIAYPIKFVASLMRAAHFDPKGWFGEGIEALIHVISALITVGFVLFGFLLSYWLAAKIYHGSRRLRTKKIEAPLPVIPAPTTDQDMGEKNPLANFKRIGIILSGGGAKGAYQAGAMQAIYEFLEKNRAHHKVQMIAATSIGSWNALFWLAGLVKGVDGRSPLKDWWSGVNVQSLIMPVRYVPTRQNYLLSNRPWQETFNAMFKGTPAGKQLLSHLENQDAPNAIRFYFTRSNIGKANLAYTTNRTDFLQVQANLPIGRPRPVVPEGTCYPAKNLDDIRKGVFSSMDIPPLFKYTSDNGDFFEDGGVIDNLPIRFGTEIEECDLLFILPLNASFERDVNQRSVFRRLARVTEVRQGVLERNAFKMIYLYNELASLRKRVAELEKPLRSRYNGQTNAARARKIMAEEKTADRALARQHNIVHVFSICPAPELLINTTEFWKTKEAEKAFSFMYHATSKELEKFDRLVNSDQIHMVLVGPNENHPNSTFKFRNKSPYHVTYLKDF